MSYKFKNQIIPETLDHVPEFKEKIDSLVANSQFVTVVGWRPDSGYTLFECLKEHAKTYMIEVFENHCRDFSFAGVRKIHSDIRNYINFLPESHRDCLLWQDGPNNVEMQEARGLLRKMQDHFNSIIIATPNGYKEQGIFLGNVNEINLSHWYKSNYEEIGFTCESYLPLNEGLIGYWERPEKIVHEVVEEFVVDKLPAQPIVKDTNHVSIQLDMSKAKKLELPDVTCICADTTYYFPTMNALWWSYCQVKFARMILFTDERIYEKIHNHDKMKAMDLEIIAIPPIFGKVGVGSYSHLFMKKLDKYIDTSHFLIIQQDGWVNNINSWTDEFLEYDYIGSPWLFYNDGMEVGNGGFSLRSTKLHAILTADPHIDGTNEAEDYAICRHYRPFLEKKYGIKFAPLEVARKFSFCDPQPPAPHPSPLPFGMHQCDQKGFEISFANIYGYF